MGDPPDDALRFGRAYEGFAAPATHTTSHLVMRRLQSTLAHRSHPKSLPPRICFFLIPANMTWALQPCDTHVMARYKRQLRLEFQNRQMAAPHGTVLIPAVHALLFDEFCKDCLGPKPLQITDLFNLNYD